MRRLYDIANVLSSLRLIEKTHVSDSRKPAFRWLGSEKLLLEEEAGPLSSVHWFINRRARARSTRTAIRKRSHALRCREEHPRSSRRGVSFAACARTSPLCPDA